MSNRLENHWGGPNDAPLPPPPPPPSLGELVMINSLVGGLKNIFKKYIGIFFLSTYYSEKVD